MKIFSQSFTDTDIFLSTWVTCMALILKWERMLCSRQKPLQLQEDVHEQVCTGCWVPLRSFAVRLRTTPGLVGGTDGGRQVKRMGRWATLPFRGGFSFPFLKSCDYQVTLISVER